VSTLRAVYPPRSRGATLAAKPQSNVRTSSLTASCSQSEKPHGRHAGRLSPRTRAGRHAKTPKRERPEPWPARIAHRGPECAEGAETSGKAPDHTALLARAGATNRSRGAASEIGPAMSGSPTRAMGRQLADWFGRPKAAKDEDAEAQVSARA